MSVAALPTAPIIVNTQATGSYYPQSWAQATTPATFWRRVWRPNNCHLSHYRKILRQNFIKPITEDLIRCRIVALPRVATLINCARPDLLISIFISKSILYSFSTSFLLWILALSSSLHGKILFQFWQLFHNNKSGEKQKKYFNFMSFLNKSKANTFLLVIFLEVCVNADPVLFDRIRIRLLKFSIPEKPLPCWSEKSRCDHMVLVCKTPFFPPL